MGFFIENAPNFRPVDLSLLATTLNGFLTALIITAIWTFLFVLVHSLGTLVRLCARRRPEITGD